MVRVTQTTRSGEPEAHLSRHKPPRKIVRHSRKQADADREQLLRALLDEAHHRIRMLERTVERLTDAL